MGVAVEEGMLGNSQMADQLAAKSWHYPLINDSERTYQSQIIQIALQKNTLVCLPTGMGKTYVALVVMYNFSRWFPHRLSIFMAPTKPLVTQQFRSWLRVFGKLAPGAAVEITANMAPEKRAKLWKDALIVFSTPQIVENDLEGGYLAKERISLLVFDEAHRAVGNYAYCGIMRAMAGFAFRVCGLTATPGSSIPLIQSLISVLRIESIQFYNEDSPELADYLSLREKEVQTVGISAEIAQVRGIIDELIRKHYASPLQSLGFNLPADFEKISISSLLNNHNSVPSQSLGGAVEGYLAGLRIFLHVRDLLVFYGILPMISYIKGLAASKGNSLKTRVTKQLLGSEEVCQMMRKYESLAKDTNFYSHPKLQWLQIILQAHFAVSESRVMIFSQYRDSVLDICEFLHRFQPQIRPATLLGLNSSSGASESARANRAHQQSTIDRFVEGSSNVLITTSIGEEGLDIGFVDLIVFFDAQTSPIRLVQRSGRTGRTRDGKIIILLNEGREEAMYQSSETSAKSLARSLASSINTFKFNFSNSLNPTSEFAADQLQCIKFKVVPAEETASKSKQKNKPLPPPPLQLIPQVPSLNPAKSIINRDTSVFIKHSLLTLELIALTNQLETEQSRNRKACQLIFAQAQSRMPIFRPFNYVPVPLEDYKLIFNTFQPPQETNHFNDELDLPDSFFEDDDDFLTNEPDLIDDFSFDLDLDDTPPQNQSVLQADQANQADMDLDMFDWSDSDII